MKGTASGPRRKDRMDYLRTGSGVRGFLVL